MWSRTNALDRVPFKEQEQFESSPHAKCGCKFVAPVSDRRLNRIVFLGLEKGGRDVPATSKCVNLFSSHFF